MRKDDELIRFQQLFRHDVRERWRRKFLRITDIHPDPAASVFGRVARDLELMAVMAVVGLPGDQRALTLAIETDTVPGALQMAAENAAGGKPRATMRAAIMHHVRPAILVPPRDEGLVQNVESKRLMARQLAGLQHRVPVIPKTKLEPFRKIPLCLSHADLFRLRDGRHWPSPSTRSSL